MKAEIKFGVIGCSKIAEKSSIPAIKSSKNSTLQMVGSRINSKAEKFAKKFSIPEFGSYDEVLENDKIDAVYISLPISLHKEWCIKSAKAGKHILCEKSSSSSFLDSQKMIKEAEKNEVRIMEGFMFRFHPSHKKVKELIRSESIGKIYSFFGRYGFQWPPKNDIRFKKDLGGGILNDAGCYHICASRMIFEKEPTGVLCQSVLDKNGVDVKTTIHLKYSETQFAQMVTGYGLSYQSSYSLWGTKGFLRLSRSYNIPANMNPIIALNFEDKRKDILIPAANHFKIMIESFSNEIKKKGTCDFIFEDELLKQAKVMDASRKSFEQNKFIELKN